MFHRRGITVLEAIVILAVAIALVGVMIVLLMRHRENSLAVQCRNNLRVVGKAFHSYHDNSAADETARRLPPSRIAEAHGTWAVLLAPYLLKDHALHSWDLERTYFEQTNDIRSASMSIYFCPARKRPGWISQAGDVDLLGKFFPGALGDYAAVAGTGDAERDWTGPNADGPLLVAEFLLGNDARILKWKSRTGLKHLEKRGTQYTALVGEKHVSPGHYGDVTGGDGSAYNGSQPASFSRIMGAGFSLADSAQAPYNRNFGSSHVGVCNFLMADGSFRAVSNRVADLVLTEMARRE